MRRSVPDWLERARSKWEHRGGGRPAFAHVPGPDEESVWDYPRPPRLEPDAREVVVRLGDREVARSHRAVRVLETASPPTVYLPPEDVDRTLLVRASGSSLCEWKGEAAYWHVEAGGRRLERAAWSYPRPFAEFESIRDHVSFYPAALACTLGGVVVQPQPGGFYGGWVTPEIIGPFKGEAGTGGW